MGLLKIRKYTWGMLARGLGLWVDRCREWRPSMLDREMVRSCAGAIRGETRSVCRTRLRIRLPVGWGKSPPYRSIYIPYCWLSARRILTEIPYSWFGFDSLQYQTRLERRSFARKSWILSRLLNYLRLNGGAGGIRTLDTLLTYTHFPGERLRPLGHRSALHWKCGSL